MKKILLFFIIILSGCTCMMSQIPPQTIYADQNCSALLPDLKGKAVVSDNCQGVITIIQNPLPGTLLNVNNPVINVTLTAKDAFGNVSKPVIVPVILLDTVPPVLNFPVGQVNMTEQDVINIYKAWEAGIKVHGIAKWLYDQSWSQGLPFADSTKVLESLKYFTNVIKISDAEYEEYVNYVKNK